jgi:hypothetical protein
LYIADLQNVAPRRAESLAVSRSYAYLATGQVEKALADS